MKLQDNVSSECCWKIQEMKFEAVEAQNQSEETGDEAELNE